MNQATIQRRLRKLRDHRKVTQEVLSQALGFNDRQTLSDIENGKRTISAEEIVRAARFFDVGPAFFTDPFELAGEARFSWRRSTNCVNDIEVFEERAGKWIAAYRHLSRLRGKTVNSALLRVDLSAQSSFEEAASEGEAISQALELGDIPARCLPEVLEEKLNTLVLNVDTTPGVSGAACQLGPLNTIIINRQESTGRRSFDLGHELFHLMTWSEMPPEHIETDEGSSKLNQRIEQLANNFSSALLMPRHAVLRLIEKYPVPKEESEFAIWIKEMASRLHVSGPALKWRLVTLGLISKASAERVDDSELRVDVIDSEPAPARFSRTFVETVGWAIEEGHLSARKAAQLINTTVDDLGDLFAEHGLKTPFDL